MSKPMVKITWTENCEYEITLTPDAAREFVNMLSYPALGEDATTDQIVDALEGADLENGLAQVDEISGANVYVEVTRSVGSIDTI